MKEKSGKKHLSEVRKIRHLLKLLRPFTLLAPAVGGLFFGLLGIKDAGLPLVDSLPRLFASCFILAMANATSNIFNQVFDADIDSLHPIKKRRPVPSGLISQGDALSLGIFLLIAVIGLSVALFGTNYGLSLSIIMLFAWIYNCPPIRMKKRFVLGNIAIAAPRGGLGITCAYSAFANPFNPMMYVAIIYFALYVFGTNTLKDFADEKYDKQCGVRNFVTVWGKKNATTFVMMFLVIPWAWLMIVGSFVEVSTLNFIPLFFSAVMVMVLAMKFDIDSIEGNSVLWTLFYLQFASMMVLYTLPLLLF